MLRRSTAISFRFTSHPSALWTDRFDSPVISAMSCSAICAVVAAVPVRGAPQVQIDDERGRLPIVADEIGQQRVDDVRVDL